MNIQILENKIKALVQDVDQGSFVYDLLLAYGLPQAAVAGRLKTDYRYSSALCYNTFPFPDISEKQKTTLEDHVFRVLDERELHPQKTMAQLYDPDKMPTGLRQAHHDMDLAVEQCYRARPFADDEERLEYLFKLYEEMIKVQS